MGFMAGFMVGFMVGCVDELWCARNAELCWMWGSLVRFEMFTFFLNLWQGVRSVVSVR